MKYSCTFVAIIFALAMACVSAAPAVPDSQNAQVLRYDSDVQVDGFKYNVELSDGSSRIEQGQLKQVDAENAAIVVSGSYSYVGDDGQTYKVSYVADENGFQPQGDHLPRVAE